MCYNNLHVNDTTPGMKAVSPVLIDCIVAVIHLEYIRINLKLDLFEFTPFV